MRYSTQTQKLLICAAHIARGLGHGYVGSAHLLLAMVKQTDTAGQLLQSAGLDFRLTEQIASVLYGVGTPGLPLPQGFSSQMQRILQDAVREAGFQRSARVEPTHILLSMLRQERTAARELLILSSIDVEDLFSRTVETLHITGETNVNKEATATKLLEQFSEDLVMKAATMEPVIGRSGAGGCEKTQSDQHPRFVNVCHHREKDRREERAAQEHDLHTVAVGQTAPDRTENRVCQHGCKEENGYINTAQRSIRDPELVAEIQRNEGDDRIKSGKYEQL